MRRDVPGLIDTGQLAVIRPVHVHELPDEPVIAAAVVETESHGPDPGGARVVIGAVFLRGPEPPEHELVRPLCVWHVLLPRRCALLVPVPRYLVAAFSGGQSSLMAGVVPAASDADLNVQGHAQLRR